MRRRTVQPAAGKLGRVHRVINCTSTTTTDWSRQCRIYKNLGRILLFADAHRQNINLRTFVFKKKPTKKCGFGILL